MKQSAIRFLLLALFLAVKTNLFAVIEFGGVIFGDVLVDGIYYHPFGSIASVTSGRDCKGDVIIPSEIVYQGDTYTVISIDSYAFAG